MLFHRFLVHFAVLALSAALDLSEPLTCRYKDQSIVTTSTVLTAASSSATPHGSLGWGSTYAAATRCPRIKPTVTITSTFTGGVSTVTPNRSFTPILSETYSVSLNPHRRRQLASQTLQPMIVSLDSNGSVTTSASELPHSLVCGPETTSSSATWTVPSNCPAQSTVTTSTAIAVPSAYVYDACASNNLVNQGFGNGDGHGINSLTFYNVTSNTGIDAATAYDCCAACQMLGCAYGGFLANPPFPYCELYFQDECDGTKWLGNTFTYNPDIVGHLPVDEGFTVFNGPCGQIVYGGSSVCKDPPCE
ncbi:MAG: hypothetical protein Q9218_004749 [Villophora microphyllina]